MSDAAGAEERRRRSGARRAALRGVAVAGSILFTALLLEVGIRLFAPVELHATDTYLAAADQRDQAGTLLLVPNAAGRERTGEFDVSIRINSHALRDREFPYEKPPGTYRVLVLGDSQTFGVGVEGEQTYAKVLERLLRQASGRPVEVINTGVPGTGTAHQLYFLERQGWKYQPDAVVTGFFFNDVNNNRLCDLYALRDGRLARDARMALDGSGELWERSRGTSGFYTYHAPERTAPPAPPFWIRYSHLARFLRQRIANVKQREVGELRAEQAADTAAARELTAHLFGELARQCAGRGVVYVAAMIPSLPECDPGRFHGREPDHAPLLRQLKQPEQVLDLMPAFRAAGCDRLFYRQDRHMTRQGHQVAAEALARKLLQVDPVLAPARQRAPGSASDGRLVARHPRG